MQSNLEIACSGVCCYFACGKTVINSNSHHKKVARIAVQYTVMVIFVKEKWSQGNKKQSYKTLN